MDLFVIYISRLRVQVQTPPPLNLGSRAEFPEPLCRLVEKSILAVFFACTLTSKKEALASAKLSVPFDLQYSAVASVWEIANFSVYHLEKSYVAVIVARMSLRVDG